MAEEVLPAAKEKGIGIIVRQPLASGLLSGQLTPETRFAENDYRKTWPREKLLADLRRVTAIQEILGTGARSLPQAALKFILAHPAVNAVVPGLMSTQQIDDAVAASDGKLLAPDLVKQIAAV
jgi:aryl-alcohol dehydrogenase-like predicted oxidoreductase